MYMSDFTHKTKFDWIVMVALVAIAFGVGGTYYRVASVDERLSSLENILIKKGINALSFLQK